VADLVARQGALGRQFAAPRHVEKSLYGPGSPNAADLKSLHRLPRVPSGTSDRKAALAS
jgi:hypothetical protein